MVRGKSICRKVGCNELIDSPGYCPAHTPDTRKYFRCLDARKSKADIDFYSSGRWQKVRAIHIKEEPLCRKCKAEGITQLGSIVHHDPDRHTLLSRGLDPYDRRYLETICTQHHLDELRKKGRAFTHDPHRKEKERILNGLK